MAGDLPQTNKCPRARPRETRRDKAHLRVPVLGCGHDGQMFIMADVIVKDLTLCACCAL